MKELGGLLMREQVLLNAIAREECAIFRKLNVYMVSAMPTALQEIEITRLFQDSFHSVQTEEEDGETNSGFVSVRGARRTPPTPRENNAPKSPLTKALSGFFGTRSEEELDAALTDLRPLKEDELRVSTKS